MSEPTEIPYFDWLCSLVCDDSKQDCYSSLLRQLGTHVFAFFVSGDDNRAEDCHDLRLEYLAEFDIYDQNGLLIDAPPCVLEVLIAFARRAEFDTDILASEWFWIMVGNLGLDGFIDRSYPDEQVVNRILEKFVFRKYSFRGHGGLFPLRHTRNDQREVEIFYQFNEYLIEHDL